MDSSEDIGAGEKRDRYVSRCVLMMQTLMLQFVLKKHVVILQIVV